MKLEINLADREEIAAAVPLLQLILNNTVAGGAAAPAPLPPAAPSIAAAAVLPIVPGAASASLAGIPAPLPPAATPAPVAPAPTASAAAPTNPAVGVELDSKGLPWDERIHASTKTKIASGEWKAKRGVDDATVAAVEAELRAVAAPVATQSGYTSPGAIFDPAAPVVTATGLPPLPEASPAGDPAAIFGGAVAPAPLPIVPPAAALQPAAQVAPLASADPTTFEQLMTAISPLVVAGKLPPTATNQAANAQGLANIVALQTAPQFVPLVWATLKQTYPAAFA